MAVLETEQYEKVINLGKQAINTFKDGNMNDFYTYAENAWDLFPNPKHKWNQGYNFCKTFFKYSLNSKELIQAKKWLNRMIENNNELHNFDEDCFFCVAKFHYENNNYTESFKIFKEVVKEAGFRYFEDEDPKYLDFYKSPKKYIKQLNTEN